MNTNWIFNHICVLESLRIGETKTAKKLSEDLTSWAAVIDPDGSLTVSYHDIVSKKDLFDVLKEISIASKNIGLFPLLHLECHGAVGGLELTSGESVLWTEIRDYFIAINDACKVNLIIVFAACEGMYLMRTANKMDRAPYALLIAPYDIVSAGEVQDDFPAFYRTLFEGCKEYKFNLDEAMIVLNGNKTKYGLHTTELLFLNAFASHLKNNTSKKAILERVERMVTEARKNISLKDKKYLPLIRKTLKEAVKEDSQHFDKFKKRYFFIDKYPENANKFNITLDDI